MLSKNVRFDDEVLTVLRSMDWKDGGRLGIITGGQLERSLYTRLNKALSIMGGKWNRSAGGHTFANDPRPLVDGLLDSGALTVEKDGFFETPRAVVERMLELLPLTDKPLRILEPSAGKGAIILVLLENGLTHTIEAIEKNADRREYLINTFPTVLIRSDVDFLEVFQEYDRIYMNPPFEELQDVDHVQHAYDLLADGGALASVMAESAFFRQDKKASQFRAWLSSVGGKSEELPDGSFKESGTGVKTRLIVINK